MVRLGDACIEDKVIVDGKSSKLPYLGLEMIESETGKIDWSAKTVAGISTCFAFDARHILYSKLRPYLNKVALPDVEGRCTTEIIPLLPKEGVCREYIAYLLRGQQTVDYVTPENSGTRMPRADMKHLFNMRIPLPPLSEQRRIAAEIERQLAAVEKARRAAAEQVAASGEIGSLYLQGVFSNNKWDTQRLGEIVDVTTGPFGSMLHKADYVSKGIPIINPQDIKSGTICPSTFVSLETANRLQAYALNTGDIVIGRRDEMGRCAVIGSDQNRWLCGTECFILRKSAKLFPDYFAMFLRSSNSVSFLRGNSVGSTMDNLNHKILKALPVSIPPFVEQRLIVAGFEHQLAQVNKVTVKITKQNDAITALPAAILRQAFSGNI